MSEQLKFIREYYVYCEKYLLNIFIFIYILLHIFKSKEWKKMYSKYLIKLML